MKIHPILILLLFSTFAQAEEEKDILRVLEHFALTYAAAGECIKPDKDELDSYLTNYRRVTTYALQEIQKRKPSLTEDQANQIVEAGRKRITEAVHMVIEKEGCNSPKIQELLERFHRHAKW